MTFTNNTKFTNVSVPKMIQARGGNLYNRVPTTEAMNLIQRANAPIIGFIERRIEGKLPKVICCDVAGADSKWLFALAKEADNCQDGVPYLFTIEAVRYNRDDTPYIMVRPVTLLSPELLENERFGDLISKSGRFPMYWCKETSTEWNYAPLCERFNLPADTDKIALCKHAVDQALAGNISFEEIVECIYLPESVLANLAVSLGGATPAKPSNTRNLNLLTPSRNKPKRKRTCKGKKYKEPRQKPTASTNASSDDKGGKKAKNKDGGKKKGK